MTRISAFLLAAAAAAPALAQQQQADPAQVFAKEWATIEASDVVAASAHQHVAELAQSLLTDYRQKLEALKAANDEIAATEARLATAMQWLKAAQDGVK